MICALAMMAPTTPVTPGPASFGYIATPQPKKRPSRKSPFGKALPDVMSPDAVEVGVARRRCATTA